MEFEKATYSYKAINECIAAIKGLTFTIKLRSQHGSYLFEVKKIYDLCYDRTKCMLFDADYSPWKDYLTAWNQKCTKKDLDACLRRAIHYLQNEILAIKASMVCGEVNSIE